MKQRLLIVFFALSLFFTSCGSSNDLDGNWIKSSSFEGNARSGAVSFVINNAAYVGTGYDGQDCLKTFYKCELDEFGDVKWTRVANEFPGEERREAVAFISNGKAYVGLGVNDDDDRLGDFYEFDPTTETWNTTAIDMNGGPSARQGAVAFSIGEIGYVGTGYGWQEGDDRNYLKDFYKYENNTWTKIAFNGEKTRNSTAFVINDKAYVVSGENSLKYVWEFDPANGWDRKEYLDDDNDWENVQRYQAVSFVMNGKGYIVTGRYSGLSREVWEYDPTRDEWYEKTSLEDEITSREDAVAFTLNDRGFFTTGTVVGSGTYFDDMWEFNPTMDETDDDN
ncbi:Kelch repeat-containing protein [Marinifilum sp. RC60d5]|uniref:Kelch repeat-containing protein n=1 Tax=Marinifilum sp. RC60d5 TaxID=3458414 RepID=UPI0040361612